MALKHTHMVEFIGNLLLVSLLIYKSWLIFVCRQLVSTCLKSEQELVRVSFGNRLLCSCKLLCIELTIFVFVEEFGQEIVTIGDVAIAIQVERWVWQDLRLSVLLELFLCSNFRQTSATTASTRPEPVLRHLLRRARKVKFTTFELFCAANQYTIDGVLWRYMLLRVDRHSVFFSVRVRNWIE